MGSRLVLMATATKTTKSAKQAAPGGLGKGGQRLSAAFEAVNSLPALAETTARVAKLTAKENASVSEIAELVESDTAIAIAVMKAANNGGGPRGRVSNVPDAIEELTPAGIRAVAGSLQTYELFSAARQLGAAARALPPPRRRHPPRRDEPRRPRRRARPRRARDRGPAPRRRPARADAPLSRATRRSSATASRPPSSAARRSAVSSASTTRSSAASSPAAGASRP